MTLGGKHFCEKLLEYGVYQNKSFKIRFPKFLDKKLIRHFVRGYLDGDGCIIVGLKENKMTPTFRTAITGNIEFCTDLKDTIESIIDINGSILHNNTSNIVNYYINGTYNCKIFLDWLYYGSTIHLIRKYKLYQKLVKYTNTMKHKINHIYYKRYIRNRAKLLDILITNEVNN